jgi:hypothetical protein
LTQTITELSGGLTPDHELVFPTRPQNPQMRESTSVCISRIDGVTAPSTFRVGNPDIGGLNLQQGGVKYSWEGQNSYGMIERSSPAGMTTIG